MITRVFLEIVNMSLTASYVILAVLLLRLLLRRFPASLSYALWLVVLLRLVLPFSFESQLALIPSARTVSPMLLQGAQPAIASRGPAVDRAVSTFGIAAEEAKRLHGETIPLDGVPAGEGYFGFWQRRPMSSSCSCRPHGRGCASSAMSASQSGSVTAFSVATGSTPPLSPASSGPKYTCRPHWMRGSAIW